VAAKSSINFEEDALQNPTLSSDKLQQIRELSEEMLAIEERLSKWALVARQLQERYEQISNQTLPELMKEVGMSEFKLTTGQIVSVAPFTHASIPSLSSIESADPEERSQLEKRRELAILWLRKHNAESLIKTTIKAVFGKGQSKAAEKYYQQIVSKGFEAKKDEAVHPQTLNKFIREQLEEGIDIPQEPFNLHTGNRAKIVSPKKGAAK
jgi:pyruvate/2-oxoglutarate dehydrogenase complex dihydrolipoamide acyltransferase (E2) component